MLNRLLNQEQSGKSSKGGSTFQKIGKGEGAAAPNGERWLCWSDISAPCCRKQRRPRSLPFACGVPTFRGRRRMNLMLKFKCMCTSFQSARRDVAPLTHRRDANWSPMRRRRRPLARGRSAPRFPAEGFQTRRFYGVAQKAFFERCSSSVGGVASTGGSVLQAGSTSR